MAKYWNDYWGRYSQKDFRRIGFFLGIIALVAIVVVYSTQYKPAVEREIPAPPRAAPVQPEPTPEVEQPQTPKGELVVALKDVRQKLSTVGLGDATELFITIKSVQVHATNDPIENKSVVASGWTTIFEGEKTIDLLEYTDKIAMIGEKELEPGNYTQIRLYISSANIKIDNPGFEVYNKTYPMHIPSNVLKIVRPFSVEANDATILTIDFDVPRMVSRTNKGYTFGPVLKAVTDEITIKEQMLEKGKRPENAVAV